MLQMLMLSVVCILIRGKQGEISSIIDLPSCSIAGFFILFSHLAICFFYSFYIYKKSSKLQTQKLNLGYVYKD